MIEKRSVFIECSSGRVPKISFLKEYVTILAKMGYNALYLGTSDTFELDSDPYFGYLRGGYSAKEIMELDGYCKQIGVELCPAIQTLAKLNHLGRYEQYKECFDIGDILMVGEEKVYNLLERIFKQLSLIFSSRTVNIGMDEAFLLGCGRYLAEHGYKNRSSIMNEHLQKVAKIAADYGFQCEMWSDMFIRIANGGTGNATYAVEDGKD